MDIRAEQTLHQIRYTNVKHIKRCSTSLSFEYCRLKATLKYHSISIPISKQTNNTKCWREHRVKELSCIAGRYAKYYKYCKNSLAVFFYNIRHILTMTNYWCTP